MTLSHTGPSWAGWDLASAGFPATMATAIPGYWERKYAPSCAPSHNSTVRFWFANRFWRGVKGRRYVGECAVGVWRLPSRPDESVPVARGRGRGAETQNVYCLAV